MQIYSAKVPCLDSPVFARLRKHRGDSNADVTHAQEEVRRPKPRDVPGLARRPQTGGTGPRSWPAAHDGDGDPEAGKASAGSEQGSLLLEPASGTEDPASILVQRELTRRAQANFGHQASWAAK